MTSRTGNRRDGADLDGAELDDAEPDEPEGAASGDRGGARRRPPIPQTVLALATAALLLFAGGYAVGHQGRGEGGTGAGRTAAPADDSVAAGFARDMQAHHAQAVQLSMIVRDRTDDSRIRTIAYDIALTQQHQIGQMYGWLDQWNLSQVPAGPPLAWAKRGMAHGGAGKDGANGAMPGMATAAQIRELERAEGRDAEIRFIDLMIPHHQAGVQMAQAALAGTDNPQVRLLAQTIVAGQTEEIGVLRRLRAELGD